MAPCTNTIKYKQTPLRSIKEQDAPLTLPPPLLLSSITDRKGPGVLSPTHTQRVLGEISIDPEVEQSVEKKEANMGWSAADGAAFKVLLALALVFGIMAYANYHVIHMKHVSPLGLDAPLDSFSEARAIEHIRRLTVDIGGRQEGQPGLEASARYIKEEIESIAARAGSSYRVEIEETLVSGAFNMIFLHHSISLAYRNHKNIVMRISSNSSCDHDSSVLVNGHFDSALGSPGAGDCGSCVASMLELARLIVDANWIPPRPIIFLFNGAEELFLLGSHGFSRTHRWSDSIGAFINIEASGTGGFDLVCQSGPGSWPSHVYAQSAKYPMANSVAQDVFGVVPGDTDYRIFAEDYDNIPGLDMIFVLGGYYYHTSYDTLEKLLPGSIQARGDNLFNLIQAFASSSKVLNATERAAKASSNVNNEDRAVFFDYLSWFMVYYSRKVSTVLHSLPIITFLLVPIFLHLRDAASRPLLATILDFMKGMLFHIVSILLAVIVPVSFAILSLLFSKHAMSWFAHPFLAFMMFLPSALIGLFLPRTLWGSFPHTQNTASSRVPKEILSDEARFWGAFGLYAFITMVYLLAGLGGGFLTYLMSISMFTAWFFYRLTAKNWGQQSLKTFSCYLIPQLPFILYSMYYGGFLVQFLIEKMGMMGSLPEPYGRFVQDVIVAATIGLVTGWSMGPLVPIVGHWLARSSILQFLMQVTVLSLALSSQFFPYTANAPKRVVFQHTFKHADGKNIINSSYDFTVVDANSLEFLFKHVPEAAKILQINSDFSFEENYQSDRSSWVALYPVPFLFSRSLKFPASYDDMLKHYTHLPQLSVRQSEFLSVVGHRRVHLEFNLGSLNEVWATVLNVTGPLSNWSFADNGLPVAERINGGPPSYICRLSGVSHENWSFWLEANSSEALRVDVAVLDQHLIDDAKKITKLFPDWADLTAFSTFLSSHHF